MPDDEVWSRWSLVLSIAGLAVLAAGLAAEHLPATGYWLWGLLHSMADGICLMGGLLLGNACRYRGMALGWRRRQERD